MARTRSAPARSRTPSGITLEDLFELRAVGRVALEPNGRRVVFELKRADAGENKNFTQLMVVDVQSGALRPLTAAGKHSDSLPRWSPDGRFIAFISSREKSAALYVLPMDGGEATRLTDLDGSVSDFGWSPDGSRLAYAYQPLSEREKLQRDGKSDELRRRPAFKHIRRLHHKLDGAGWWNGNYTHIWIVPRDGGRSRQLTDGDYDDREPRFSPDGRWVSYLSNRVEDPDLYVENADVYLVKPSGGPSRRLKQTGGACAAHSWSPDGKTIAYVGDAAGPGESWKFCRHVWLLPARGGSPAPLTTDIDNNCQNETMGDVATASFQPIAPIWSADSQRVFFTVSQAGSTHLYSRGVAERASRLEISGDQQVMFGDRAAGDGLIAYSAGNATNPGDVFVFNPVGGVTRQLTTVNGDLLSKRRVGVPEPFTVRSDGLDVHGWVLHPPGFSAARRYPAILQIHGGPHTQYGHGFFHEMQWLAAQGYVVCFANPRGSTGYGLKFSNAIHHDWGNRDYADLMKVADWLAARRYVDRKRIGVTGGSYGGYMTNWIIARTQRFRAAVTQRSVVNAESMFGTSDYGYELGHEFGGSPWKDTERLRRQSPLSYVQSIRTPLLIEHEEEDHRCPIEQAEQLFTALKVLGRTVEMFRFEGESHGLSRTGRPQNRAERLRRILDWFERYLK